MNLNYKSINNISGWIAFVIAAITYLLTVEPTTSLWDCGEFITSAYGLEVGHPPGAPFFMILARFFALFAPDPTKVALMVNILSALASAFTILFLFWTITHLAKKMIDVEKSKGNLIAVIGAGFVGALAYTFSDTFWFSAVEGEVYALSSLFTAVVFWCILKWEDIAHTPYANRWIILIAYLMGLSIGVHLLNLLAIPAIVFVYYFKKHNVSRNGIIVASLISIVSLAVIMYGIIPGVVKVAAWFELLFVNGLGFGYNTGVIIYAIILIAVVVWGILYTIKHNMVILNTILTAFVVIVIGYSSFAMIVIRSQANPPMDENNPDNVFALLSYLNREQYGDRPLLYGEYFNAPAIDMEYTKPVRIQKDGKYKIASRKPEYTFDSRFTTIFPRMYSSQPAHVRVYKQWGNVKNNNPIRMNRGYGEGEVLYKPSFGSNLRYFLSYQVGHMYWRYFMWNFAGRQNDVQGYGGILNGNWISGIKFLDEMRLGNQDKLYSELKNKKSRNTYFMLPFLLGILGMIFMLYSGKIGKQNFSVVMLLFFFTGLAIVVYLNQYPNQPRERDYAYAGSFYAFAIWIGFGVLWLYNIILKNKDSVIKASLISVACLILVPGIMAQQNWDDHDRSGRYATIAYAKNYLNSCEKDAILFTYGDNDTFPLWYAQEVEGIRRDIRIINLSLLAGDWYINQMRRKAYESAPIKMSIPQEKVDPGVRDQIPVEDVLKGERVNVKDAIQFIASDNPDTKLEMTSGKSFDYCPTKRLYFKVDSAKIVQNGTVKAKDAHLIVDSLAIDIKKNYLYKNDLMVFDIIAENNWERPVYFSVGMGQASFLGFDKYFQLEGACYRIVPIATRGNEVELGRIDSDILYDNYMNKFSFGNIKDEDVYVDQFHIMTLNIMTVRNGFGRLAVELNDQNKKDKAIAILDKCMEELPIPKIPIDNNLIGFIQEYYRAGAVKKANDLLLAMSNHSFEKIDYFLSLSDSRRRIFGNEIDREARIVQMLVSIARSYEQNDVVKQITSKFDSFES
ncbi:MAG: DUF2723 domain-containing protein [Marinifilaceae bacterium]|jgi:hypothetical protein|nr:DUF2723 domain-containing protein [Marinifilaceae bacterium]